MLQKFIWWTGLSDFLVGAGTWAGAIGIAMASEPLKGQFVPLITLGTFLMMAAALLMWSSHDMTNRAPVFFWQGLVRLSGHLRRALCGSQSAGRVVGVLVADNRPAYWASLCLWRDEGDRMFYSAIVGM